MRKQCRINQSDSIFWEPTHLPARPKNGQSGLTHSIFHAVYYTATVVAWNARDDEEGFVGAYGVRS